MIQNAVNIAGLTRFTAGGQQRFSLPGITDLKKKAPHLRGFFLSVDQ
ncbi:hypothetical protein [Erwinia endophytica]|nr:hypothetical protein [Erwinia endophytica]